MDLVWREASTGFVRNIVQGGHEGGMDLLELYEIRTKSLKSDAKPLVVYENSYKIPNCGWACGQLYEKSYKPRRRRRKTVLRPAART